MTGSLPVLVGTRICDLFKLFWLSISFLLMFGVDAAVVVIVGVGGVDAVDAAAVTAADVVAVVTDAAGKAMLLLLFKLRALLTLIL